MTKIFFALIALCLGLYATPSSAQIFNIKITDYGTNNATFKAFVDTEIQKIETELNKDLPGGEPTRLMEGMANASVLAGKGIGADYASNMQVFLIGAGVGAGADLKKDKQTDSDLSGVGVAPGAVIGANLGALGANRVLGLEAKRLNLYLNFMAYNHHQPINEKEGEESSADIKSKAMGFRLRYDWIKGNGSKWLGWGGVKFHFGYEYNKTDIVFKSKINETVNETDAQGNTMNGSFSGSPEARILVNTHSIPLELSTDVQILYILSLYGGIGADYSFGQAKGSGDMNGAESAISCTNAGVGQACSGGTTVRIKPEANIDATGKATAWLYRGFAGVQINLPYLRIYAQVNKPIGNDLIGANVGVRFVY